MRDLFMTTRSFLKRLTAFLRYRRATQDMNKRYEDATVEDIQREDTCIICREEMRPWSVTNPQAPPAAAGAPPPARSATTVNERTRPKKLPCGHILHLGCLKSWLERQQVCPTCRRPVVDNTQPARTAENNANQGAQGAQPPIGGQDAGAQPPVAGRGAVRGMRMLNFGPLRVGFGQANLQDIAQGLGGPLPGPDNAVAGGPRVYGLELGIPRRQQPQPQVPGPTSTAGPAALQNHLQQIEQSIMTEIRALQVTQQELQLVQLLQVELARLRLLQNGATDQQPAGLQPQLGTLGARQTARFTTPPQQVQRHGARPNTSAIPAGSADLPPGVIIPEGWTLLPLQRLDGPGFPQSGTIPPAANARSVPTATTTQEATSPTPGLSNNTSTPISTATQENQSQTSPVNPSDTNTIQTTPSIDQSNLGSSTVPDTTLPSTMPTASTSASQAPSAPSVLPNWGSSQLFSGPSFTTSTDSGNMNPATAQNSGDNDSSTDVGQSSSLSRQPSGEDSEQRRRERSTARAATVEDAVDEADGV
jgi:E3 ubiquitin-protein ligase synoviolin